MVYSDQLTAIGITLVTPFTTAKAHHMLQCNTCTNIWSATPIAKLQAYKKYGTNGCPKCNLARKTDSVGIKRDVAKQALKDKGLIILSEWDGSQSTTYKILVQRISCQHKFESAPGNLLHRNVECPVCNNEVKKARCIQNNLDRHGDVAATSTEWRNYTVKVKGLSEVTYRNNKDQINPNNLPRGNGGIDGVYHVDHIIPIRWCFDQKIPATMCADVSNLQMLSWEENRQASNTLKGGAVPSIFVEYRSELNIEELFR